MTDTASGLQQPALAVHRAAVGARPRADRMLSRRAHAPGDLGPPQDTVVEQAKGVLMLRYGIGSYESLAMLAQWSHDAHRQHSRSSPRALVKGICQGHAGPRDRGVVRWLEHRLREEVLGQDATGCPRPRPRRSRWRRSASRTRRSRSRPTMVQDRPEDVTGSGAVPDVAVLKKWRYASAVHAARALHRS